jgi:predicted permease
MAWKYILVLHKCITILLTIAVGYFLGRLKVFDAKVFVPQMVKFVFYVALPFLICQGLGVNINFYEDKYIWSYIGSFFILRLFTLIISFCIVRIQQMKDNTIGIGQVAVTWLCLSWISTVILGAPILGAVFGDNIKGISYGILAAISSFVLQLPLQLLFLECHAFETQRRILNENPNDIEDTEDPTPSFANTLSPLSQEGPELDSINRRVDEIDNCTPKQALLAWLETVQQRDILSLVGKQILSNPVLWGIAGGFILSLSTIGPTYLKSPSKYADWFSYLTTWVGGCVSPLSLFTMGVWISSQSNIMRKISPLTALSFMASKLLIMPILMVGISKAFNLDDEAGRAAVLIACVFKNYFFLFACVSIFNMVG